MSAMDGWNRVVWASLATTALCSAGTAADDAATTAQKVVKKATNEALADLDTTLAALAADLDSELDVVDQNSKNGGATLPDSSLAFEALKTFQIGLDSALEEASVALQEALALAGTLTDPELPATNLPKGLAFGDGGTCDTYRDSVLEKVDHAVASAEKRMRKTAKLFEKHANIGFCIRLERPRTFCEAPGPAGPTFAVVQHSFAILMSAARLTGTQETRLYAFGICHSTDDLELKVLESSGNLVSHTVTIAGNRWEKTFVDLPEDYYVLKIDHDNVVGGGAYGAINVR